MIYTSYFAKLSKLPSGIIIAPTYVESEITISQTKMDVRLCEDWSIPAGY